MKATYELPFKRRLRGLTDYRARLKLLKSRKPRLVVRKTNKRLIAELMEYVPSGDKVIVYATSDELEKYGWNFSKKNTPAAYLTGYLIAKKALKKGIREAVFDIGLQSKGSRLYAFLKGAIDAGLNIPASEDIFPSEERIKGKHIEEAFKNVKNKNQFSKIKPTDISKVFDKVKKSIEGV
ncbi:MAG: 50S ribosomal protein L18 [Candidatus Aenigmarchaeota archaeon]|nr:50S ribosomal protein L18 [Candidatus Aenigmarchaeota archaeon]MBU5688975.1 50S ribosomal protein L18 [Candidatus Aenigmarchaeota archaeon]